MSDAWRALGGRRRTLARQVYGRDRSTAGYVCPICRGGIEWSLEWPDPMSKSVDHEHELQDGGPLEILEGLRTAHLKCNSSKGASRRHERYREARTATAVISLDPRTL